MDVPSSHGLCGGAEDSCGKSCSGLVPFVHASVGWSFITVTLSGKAYQRRRARTDVNLSGTYG